MLLRDSLVPTSNRHINVEMRSCLFASEQVECPAACNPPTKWSVRKQGLNVFGLERNDIRGIGRLCVHRLRFTPALAALPGHGHTCKAGVSQVHRSYNHSQSRKSI